MRSSPMKFDDAQLRSHASAAGFTITPAALDDLDALEALEKACFSIPWSRQSLTTALETANTLVLAARVDGEVAGYAGMQTVLDQGDIYNLAVLPRYRRLGLAKALLSALLTEGAALGLAAVTLEVRASNHPAQSLYTGLGFVQTGLRRSYYDNPKEDALLLTYHYSKEDFNR